MVWLVDNFTECVIVHAIKDQLPLDWINKKLNVYRATHYTGKVVFIEGAYVVDYLSIIYSNIPYNLMHTAGNVSVYPTFDGDVSRNTLSN